MAARIRVAATPVSAGSSRAHRRRRRPSLAHPAIASTAVGLLDVFGDGVGSLANSTTITFEPAIRCAPTGGRGRLRRRAYLPDFVWGRWGTVRLRGGRRWAWSGVASLPSFSVVRARPAAACRGRSFDRRSFLATRAVLRASESWVSFMGTTRSRASSSRTSTSARVNSRSIVFATLFLLIYGSKQLPNLLTTPTAPKLCQLKAETLSIERDVVPKLLEKALGHLLGLAGQPADLPEQNLLLGGQVLGHDHLHDDVLVAATAAPDVRHAAPGEAERLAVLSSARDGDLDLPFEGRDLDPIAKGRLDHVDPELVDDVLLVPGEMLMGFDAQDDIEVSWLAAPEPGLPFPADATLRSSVHAGRDLDRKPFRLLHAALSAAFLARVLEQATCTTAGWTGGSGDDLAEDRLCLAPNLPRATAPGACLLACTWLGAAAAAAIAGGESRDVDLLFDPGERLFEGDRQVVAEIVAAVGPFASSATAETASEKGVEDVCERHIGEVDARSRAGLDRGVAEHVVRPPPPWIGEHRIRLAGFLEPGGRDGVVRIAIGMRVHGDLPKGALQVLGRALPGHTQDFVVVALDCQILF